MLIVTYHVTKLVAMDITFASRKLEKAFNEEASLKRAFNARMVRAIVLRMAVLRGAKALSLVPSIKPVRCHPLLGDKKGQYAVDLIHPFRLVFRPNHQPVPLKDDGGININEVTAIEILEVTDYH